MLRLLILSLAIALVSCTSVNTVHYTRACDTVSATSLSEEHCSSHRNAAEALRGGPDRYFMFTTGEAIDYQTDAHDQMAVLCDRDMELVGLGQLTPAESDAFLSASRQLCAEGRKVLGLEAPPE